MDERKNHFGIIVLFFYLKYASSPIILLVKCLLFANDLKKKDQPVGYITTVLDFRAPLVAYMSSESQSKKNYDRLGNKDQGEVITRGSSTEKKKSKQFGSTLGVHLEDALIPLPFVLVGCLPQTAVEMKTCVLVGGNKTICQLSFCWKIQFAG